MNVCDQCGAVFSVGEDCQSCFHALLAYENERPPAFGAVHHLTVATYYLQHPAGFTSEVLRSWYALLADTLDGRATPRELLRRARERFDGAKRVRDASAVPPAWWPREWPVTVQSVLKLDEQVEIDDYIARARSWASATRERLLPFYVD